jgi:predicted nucleotidyltransferase
MIIKTNIKTNIKQLCRLVEKKGYPLDKVIIFGSSTKQKKYNDIDLALFSKKFGHDSTEELMMLNKMTTKVNPLLEAHPFHTSQINDKYSTLLAEVKKGQNFIFYKQKRLS